ncbi:hypothetical protein [Schumannella sp. 10F1B-5-1]|uniref:hypothetical protein n=1 Tax=Schumannella sp. 10F1B-5-1 TaxID=2590780 RepID=UPI0011326D44|nr:hypothetical protein [Schumannella sp. 10F1B-5-1]TPW70173.1 hypothetical protein FJ658_14220 [Schumannella sp. 10F1B-5-1]
MTKVVARLVSVSWWPGSDLVPAGLTYFSPPQGLPACDLEGNVNAFEAGRRLARQVVPPLIETGGHVDTEPVAFFIDDSGSVVLVFTAVGPPAAGLIDADGALVQDPSTSHWRVLDSDRVDDEPKEIELVRHHWREQLATTSALCDFLPKYFTASQARSAFDGLWGGPQDAANFYRWLHRDNADAFLRVGPVTEVAGEQEDVVANAIAESAGLGVQVGRALSAGVTALTASSKLSALGAAASVVPFVALAAARIYISTKQQRGPAPQLFVRSAPERIRLESPYGPRPVH